MKILPIIAAAAMMVMAPTVEARVIDGSNAVKSIKIAGRVMECDNNDIVTDSEIPSEGAAGGDTLIINPGMINQLPPVVRWFVFSHECGHLSSAVGMEGKKSEFLADCFAVHRGVKQGWLKESDLQKVYDSWDGAPETSEHPSAFKREQNVKKCFADASKNEKEKKGDEQGRPLASEQPLGKQSDVKHPWFFGWWSWIWG